MRPRCYALFLLLASCTTTATEPPRRAVVGTYTASLLQVGVYDHPFNALAAGGTMTLTLTQGPSFLGAVDLPAPLAPFSGDTGSYASTFSGNYRLGAATDSLYLVATGETPVWVTSQLTLHQDTIRGYFRTDPPRGIRLTFVLVRSDDVP